MKLTYINFGVRVVDRKAFGTEKDYTFEQGVPQEVSEADVKIILEKASGEFESEAPKEPKARTNLKMRE